MSWFNVYGFLFVITIMVPNIVFAITHKDGFENKYQNKWIETLEQMVANANSIVNRIMSNVYCSGKGAT